MSLRSTRLKAAFGSLVFVGIGGAMAAGAIAFANTLTTRQSPQSIDLRHLVQFPTTVVQFPASNADTKTDRLPVVLASLGPARPAAPDTATNLKWPDDIAKAAEEPAPAAKAAMALMPVPVAPGPKVAVVKPPKPTNVVLNDAQIASLKQRLRLTASQEQYWPEIEVALRAVVKQIYEANKKAHGTTVPVDTSTPEVERLKTAAVPFLMQMRPDQKAEIITLARVIGMEKMVAML